MNKRITLSAILTVVLVTFLLSIMIPPAEQPARFPVTASPTSSLEEGWASTAPIASANAIDVADVSQLQQEPTSHRETFTASPQTSPGSTASVDKTSLPTQQIPAVSLTNPTIPLQPVPNQVVITFKPGIPAADRQAYLEALGGTVVQQIEGLNSIVVNISSARTAFSLPTSPVLVASEPDYYAVALGGETNDPLYPQQWSLPVIGASEGWLTLPSDAVTIAVAVIDSGICADHPDLQGRILPGYDFVEGDENPQDDYGHGCGVAGVIAANVNNAEGIAGIAPNARIIPVRVLNGQGIGTYSNVAAGIVYAVDHGAKIINLSLGGANTSVLLQNAIDYAISRNITVVAAAGNTGGSVLYPAAYVPVIAVASVDANLQRSSFSSYGPEVDILAPGRDILTTHNNGGYSLMTGTSFAAPQVSSILALDLVTGKTLILNGEIVSFEGVIQPTPLPTFDSNTGVAQQYYYYYQGRKISLTLSQDWVAIRFADSNPNVQVNTIRQLGLSEFGDLGLSVQIPSPPLTLVPLQRGLSTQSVSNFIGSLPQTAVNSFEWVNPVFHSGSNKTILTDEFVAQFVPNLSLADIAQINAANGVEIIQEMLMGNRTYLLRVMRGASLDALQMSNQYYENGYVVYAEPNFVFIGDFLADAPNDTYYDKQWGLHDTNWPQGVTLGSNIHAEEAWGITTGSPDITIAVIDSGVDIYHEDLQNKIIDGHDFTGHNEVSPSPDYSENAHGTAVAGLAAAESNNGVGIAGVCQKCKIMPIRVSYLNSSGSTVGDSAWFADGITWAWQNGADISSNSWYSSDPLNLITNAIHDAVTKGRDGRGSIVVFASGNDNGPVAFPASLPEVIAVGASNWCDQRIESDDIDHTCGNSTWGSNYGPELDIVAPGESLITTDITGENGFCPSKITCLDNNNYGYFNGTSAATPIVSGVVGLMLSVNQNLTAAMVRQLLPEIADDTNITTHPGWDNELGAGRVNAFKAVSKALSVIPECIIDNYLTRISVGWDGSEANGQSSVTDISPDGRYVVFASLASNLVPFDTNGKADVFVYDRKTCLTEGVSVSSYGVEGNADSGTGKISADGRYVVFDSVASNLVAGDLNIYSDIFLHDRLTGETKLISSPYSPLDIFGANYHSWLTSITDDGRYIAFFSAASNLVAESNNDWGVFLYDCVLNTMTLVTSGANGEALFPSLSPDGRFLAFQSEATNLVAGDNDTNDASDIFIYDLQANQIVERVSQGWDGSMPNERSFGSSTDLVSINGHFVLFESLADNLIQGDTNGKMDVFVRDRQSNQTERISVNSDGVEGNDVSRANNAASLSSDGRYVVFTSFATNLINDGNTSTCNCIYLRDRQENQTFLISVAPDGSHVGGQYPLITGDNRYVVFSSDAKNLVDGDTSYTPDVFVADLTLLPPLAPRLTSPTNFAVVTTSQPTLSWARVDGAASYEIQLDTNNPPTTSATSTTDMNFTPESPLIGSIYYWRVRAKSANNIYSNWSTTWGIEIDPPSPDIPLLSSPTDMEMVTTDKPTFTWQTANEATSYEIQLDTLNPPASPVIASNTTSYTPNNHLAATIYFWRVRAVGGTGKLSNWSDVRSVTVDPAPPDVPMLVSPENGTTILTQFPNFSWYPTNLAVSYEFQLDVTDPPQNTMATVSNTNYTPDSLYPDTTYYWRVRAVGSSGKVSDWSSVWSVTIELPAPPPPILVAPDNGMTVSTNRPTLSWQPVSDVDAYEIQLSWRDLATASVKTVFSTSYMPSAPLLTTTYQWQVRSVGNNGKKSEWSPTFSFTVASQIGAAPVSNLYEIATPTLRWGSITWAQAYHVEWDTSTTFNPTSPTYHHRVITPPVPEITLDALSNGVYHWRVQAQRANGTWSGWSVVDTFVVDIP